MDEGGGVEGAAGEEEKKRGWRIRKRIKEKNRGRRGEMEGCKEEEGWGGKGKESLALKSRMRHP